MGKGDTDYTVKLWTGQQKRRQYHGPSMYVKCLVWPIVMCEYLNLLQDMFPYMKQGWQHRGPG